MNPFLKDITVRDVQRFIDVKAKRVKANSINKYLVPLKGALDDAVRFGEIAVNPCTGTKLPKQKEKFQGKAYTQDEARTLLEYAMQDENGAGIVLALFLGLRRSEIAGLRWQDIDFSANKVHIRNTVTKFRTTVEAEQTKSDAGRRDLVLSPQLKFYLQALRNTQRKNKELAGSSYVDSGHICQWADGREQTPDYIYRHFKDAIKRLQLPDVRLHDLRHTAGSLLINNGRNVKQVQEFLGHEDVSTTLNTYTHIDEAARAETAAALNSILAG